jgi:catechol 2,3-dioxygenase-like lactoylglutathione lyase family enzyme
VKIWYKQVLELKNNYFAPLFTLIMKFTGNRDIAVGVTNLKTAASFYENVLGFTPNQRERNLLVYNTGHFTLYVKKGDPHPPVPSFTVQNLKEAKELLRKNNCSIIEQLEKSLYFIDPTGIVWDIIEK